jgi:hypothetical protein
VTAKPPFVVTGCARSGTKYAAELLNALGIPCGHESVFRPGIGRPTTPGTDELQGDSSWLAAPYLDGLGPGTVVLHQVREPLAVVRSHLGFHFFAEPPPSGAGYVAAVRTACPEVFDPPDELRRALRYWESWNRLVEDGARRAGLRYRRYRLEDMDAPLLAELAGLLGHRPRGRRLRKVLGEVARTTNTWGTTPLLSWDAVPDPERRSVRRLATEYGYA